MSISQNYPLTSPSLSLDFANTKALDPRITFSRPTSAVYYDGQTVTKAEENLLTYSEDVSQAVWTTNVSSKGLVAGTNPLGVSQNISRVTASGAGRGIQQARANTGTFALSVWLRSVSGSGNASILLTGITDSGYFAITSDWVRYTLTGTGTLNDVRFLAELSGDVFEFWGAQLEQRDTVTAYTPTTTQPITNYIPTLLTAPANEARFDHNPVTGESLGLLVEEQRTNLVLRSEEFDNVAWTKSNATVTADTIVAPDGTLTGDLLSVVSSGRSYILSLANTASNTVLSGSIFVKAGNQNNVCLTTSIGNVGVRQWFNLATATSGSAISLGGVKNSSEITSIGNDWYRISLSITASAGTAQYLILDVVTGDNVLSGNSGDNVYIWGAQLEAGSFPTSYIPTVASQVTRSADSATMSGSNFSSWYSPAGGTMVIDTEKQPSNSYYVMMSNSSPQSAFITQRLNIDLTIISANLNVINVYQALADTPRLQWAISFSPTTIRESANGSSIVSGSGAITTTFDRLSFGGFAWEVNGVGGGQAYGATRISRFAYYPVRLSDTNLQALTS